jgi:hypothetical protein
VQAILTPLGVHLLHHQDRALRLFAEAAARARSFLAVFEAGRTLFFEALAPLVERVRRHAHEPAEVLRWQLAAQPRVEDQQALARVEGRARRNLHRDAAPRLLAAPRHQLAGQIVRKRRTSRGRVAPPDLAVGHPAGGYAAVRLPATELRRLRRPHRERRRGRSQRLPGRGRGVLGIGHQSSFPASCRG